MGFKDNVFVVKPKYKEQTSGASRQKTESSRDLSRTTDVADEEQPLKHADSLKVELK